MNKVVAVLLPFFFISYVILQNYEYAWILSPFVLLCIGWCIPTLWFYKDAREQANVLALQIMSEYGRKFEDWIDDE